MVDGQLKKGLWTEVEALLRPEETDLPEGVEKTVSFFLESGAWCKFSRNPVVLSCREAASRRSRLGYEGIPLSDELRSYAIEVGDDKSEFLLLHCRGSSTIDFSAVEELKFLKNRSFQKANFDKIEGAMIGYGLINPFTAESMLSSIGPLKQVFDAGILGNESTFGTMMTNAGSKTWAVEFDPIEILAKFKKRGAVTCEIATGGIDSIKQKSIGILTGNAPDSGGLLWRKINAKHKKAIGQNFRGDISRLKVQVNSKPWMGLSMELASRERILKNRICTEVQTMSEGDADVIGFACNTTQYFSDPVRDALKGSGSEFVDLPSLVRRWITDNSDKRIFIAGIDYVTEDSEWSAFRFIHKMDNVIVPNEELSKQIVEIAYLVKLEGVTGVAYQKFRALLRRSNGGICLLLLTELSQIFEMYEREKFGDKMIVDAMDIYASEIVTKALT